MKRVAIAGAAVAAIMASVSGRAADAPVAFTGDETALIAAQGPWPPATAPDPSNRVSGDPAAIRLGRRLFSSPALSSGRDHSCASCHDPGRGFTDGRARGRAIGQVERNTPALYNLRLRRWYGWGGRSDSLWAQSIHPILDARELGLTPATLRARIAGDAALAEGYRAVFGTEPAAKTPEALLVDVAKALAAYQETIVSGRTAFDDFRDALLAGDRAGIDAYPAAAQRGLRLFLGKAHCVLCHFGPDFTSGGFHDTGLAHRAEAGRFDSGRYRDAALLLESPFNLTGPWNDDPARTTAGFTAKLRRSPRQWGAFRTPSLRNLTRTAPYMHDGSLKTLEAVVRHYSEPDADRLPPDDGGLIRPLHLSDAGIADLVAFLKTL